MKPLRLLQRRIIATNLAFVLLLLFGILTALFLNARARVICTQNSGHIDYR